MWFNKLPMRYWYYTVAAQGICNFAACSQGIRRSVDF